MKKYEHTYPTPDGVCLEMQKTPRNTILGASLVLEGLFPDMSAKEINRASPLLAKEFDEVINKK